MALIRGMQFALRTLTRYPGAHAAAILILSLAIGTVVAILSIVDELLWSPMRGIEAPEETVQLFAVSETGAVDTNRDVLRLPNVAYVQDHDVAFEDVAWLTFTRRALFNGDEPEELVGRSVSGGFFPLMRTRAALGRLIEPQDTVPGAAPVVVLGEEFWARRYSRAPNIVGSSLTLDGVEHRVVGIAPQGFFSQFGGVASVWLPHVATAEERANRDSFVAAFARLKPGIGIEQGNQDLRRMAEKIAQAHPDTDEGMSIAAVPLGDIMSRFRPIAIALVLAALLVVGVASANVANLLLAQALQRTREFAVRQALGADFRMILHHWGSQIAILMVVAAGIGTLLGHWVIEWVVSGMPTMIKNSASSAIDPSLDWHSWILTLVIAVSCTLVIAFVPARQATRANLGRVLRDGGGGAAGRVKGRLISRSLLCAQVTLASALTFGSLSAYLHFVYQKEKPLGFDAADVTQLHLTNLHGTGDGWTKLLGRLQQLVEHQAAFSGRLALVNDPPLTKEYEELRFYVEGTAKPEAAAMLWGKRIAVSPSYFSVLGVKLVEGRGFGPEHGAGAPCALVFSKKLAQGTFGSEPVVGRRVHLEAGGTCEIIGVVEDVHDVLDHGPGDVYVSIFQSPPQDKVVALAKGSSSSLIDDLRRRIRDGAPHQVIVETPLTEVVAATLWPYRTLVGFFSVIAGLGLALSVIGIHAMMSHAQNVRRKELAIRAALGAEPIQQAVLVVRDSAIAGLIGIGLGLSLAVLVLSSASSWRPAGWVYLTTIAVVAAFLATSALLCFRRVAALTPAAALRQA